MALLMSLILCLMPGQTVRRLHAALGVDCVVTTCLCGHGFELWNCIRGLNKQADIIYECLTQSRCPSGSDSLIPEETAGPERPKGLAANQHSTLNFYLPSPDTVLYCGNDEDVIEIRLRYNS